MPGFNKIITLIMVNALGFFSVSICYYAGLLSGVIASDDPGFNAESFRNWFFAGIMMTWLVCALFSLASLFLKGNVKKIFLWAPVVVPLAYGLSVLFLPSPL